jgi:hypothetical protein
MQKTHPTHYGHLIVAFVACVLPTTLLWLGIIPYSLRFWLLMILSFAMVFYAVWRQFSLADLGIRTDNLRPALKWNMLFTTLLVAAMAIAYSNGFVRFEGQNQLNWFFLFYIVLSSPAQEFIYRSLIFAELKHHRFASPVAIVILSALNFSYLHVFYNDWITLLVTLFMGVIWGIIYHHHPNWLSVSLSHALLGASAIFIGLI